ncbi:Gfo/Idh/MocA family protein [Sunxiuqinia sp. A32]|uniref:Gfo/Idh/MocA family protein n=1 Tax=Sunxiuqinia sp. A32 TaxID=3461496 RepID=UPI0040459F4A
MTNRRNFIKKTTLGAAGVAIGGTALGMSAKSYSRIIGANDRLAVAVMGCGRRVGAYYNSLKNTDNNVDLAYICDVMKKQREKVAKDLAGKVSGKAKLEVDIRKVLDDSDVDVVFVAAPDHWHAPAAWMAMEAGKHVYLEKPCSHNPREGEVLVTLQKKYGKHVQMGNQQRSSAESIDIISQIHNGVIGEVYKAVAFYSNTRGEVVVPKVAPVPEGLNWELFQGPAPRKAYEHDTWDYNWHWYGWDYGTAETGNNATHELDVARWALQVDYPEWVDVEAAKRHFKNDGWSMYDTMDATFRFPGNKVIKWDGKSRNGYKTYGADRGTIIYGSEGSVFVDRNGYQLFDRGGKLVSDSVAKAKEAGTALGGGGAMTDIHVANLFKVIRGTDAELNSPIEMGAISQMLTHYANISYRTNKSFGVNTKDGRIKDEEAMKLWGREYEPGWEPKI